MRELTEEEAAMINGGATEGAPLDISSSQRLIGRHSVPIAGSQDYSNPCLGWTSALKSIS